MKLVVLDPVYLNDRHIRKLRSLGRLLIYKDLPADEKEILSRIKNADIIISASVNITGRVLKKCKSLRAICLACSGYNRIDIKACQGLGIVVMNVPDYATEAVAEHTFALLFALMKKVRELDCHVRSGQFNRGKIRLLQLSHKVFGIIGTGKIGSRVARIANCFNCKVIAHTLHPSVKRGKKLGVRYVKFTKLLKESDIISLHIPLNHSTTDLISHKEFSLMKKGPIIINTSRGRIINHQAIISALSKGLIGGGGLDVLPDEPPRKDDPLLKFSNIVFSPHNAFCTTEALEHCASTVLSNLESFLRGRPQNKVDNG